MFSESRRQTERSERTDESFELELYDMKSANVRSISVLVLSDLARQHGSSLSKVDSLKT